MSKRKNRELTEDELEEMEAFLNKNNVEEEKLFQTISINVKPKTDNQKNLVESIKHKEITICNGLAGSGKAQPLYSNILTTEGWVKMGDITTDTYVITPKGNKSRVLNVYPQGEKDIYKITFSDGRTVESCDEHLWKVYDNQNESVKTLRYIIDNYSENLSIPVIESSGNVEIKLPIDPYILGKNISTFKKLMTSNNIVEQTTYISLLENLGLSKSEEISIPKIYKNSSKSQKTLLIKGLMNEYEYFITDNEQLKNDFIEISRSIGGVVLVQTEFGRSGNYILKVTFPTHLKIDKIEYVGKLESQCIYIEDEDHMYITDNYVQTHNTFLSCAEALKMVISKTKYKRLVLIKSITPLKNEEMGHLPGDIKEKMGPIMESFTDNIRKIIGKSRMEKLLQLGVIEILPIAFARGRTIDNSIILIDEAQNISLDNIRTLMTRIGENSKMVILGDVKQNDMKNKRESSLQIVLEKFKDKVGFGCVELRNPEDVIRNPIINIIEQVFDELNEK
jgi:phosphate starvation-inducible protein PhoH